MPDLVDVKLTLLRELIGALEAERDEKIVMWSVESTSTDLVFHTLRFSLSGAQMAEVDAAAEAAGLWVKTQ